MSLFPKWGASPAESTVEQDANHLLLSLLPGPAWFFVPTRNEERHLGYDASLQGFKACVLQYKRARTLKSGGISISINVDQLATLTTRFGRGKHPYVFIGASEMPNYSAFGQAVRSLHPHIRAHHILYVPAHSIPAGSTILRLTRRHVGATAFAQCYSKGAPQGKPIECISALQLVHALTACTVGHRTDSAAEFARATNRAVEGRLSILLAHVPHAV